MDEEMGDGVDDREAAQPAMKRRRFGEQLPFFKTDLGNPDDKAENDCFFSLCARVGVNQDLDLVKHFIENHALISGDQGRQEGGGRKVPKYLTVCPSDWPYNHVSSSSCKSCGDVNGLLAVLGQREHESPCICSFCWAYLPTRRDLVQHINQGSCKSNDMFIFQLALIREMYAESIRMPGAGDIFRAATGQRQAHAEAERLARAQHQQQTQQPPPSSSTHRFTPPTTDPPTITKPPGSAYLPVPLPRHQEAQPPAPASAPPTPASAPPAPTAAPLPAQTSTTSTTTTSPTTKSPTAAGGVEYAVPAATADSMARSIERLSTLVGDLTAANAQLLRDVRARDEQISARDEQIADRDEQIAALSRENKELRDDVEWSRVTGFLEGHGGEELGGR